MPPNKAVNKEFFTYNAETLGIAPGIATTFQIAIQADADFAITKMCYFADIAAAAQTDSNRIIPLVNVLITDTGSSRQLMDRPVPIPSMFGIGEIPFILPQPRVFKANSNIQIDFINFDAAVTYNIRLAFIGFKIYRY